MPNKTFMVDDFASACKYIKVVRHTVMNALLQEGEVSCYLSTSSHFNVVEKEDDIDRVRSEIAYKLKNSLCPCVRRAYSK